MTTAIYYTERVSEDEPWVEFRLTRGDPFLETGWLEVHIPVDTLPPFYWAAYVAGWAVDLSFLLKQFEQLGVDFLEAMGPEDREFHLQVKRHEGNTVLVARN